jgi:excisionase family DNA binding protein
MAELLTKQQLANECQVSTRTVDRWRSMGQIRCVKVGGVVRFRPEDVAAFLLKNSNRPPHSNHSSNQP